VAHPVSRFPQRPGGRLALTAFVAGSAAGSIGDLVDSELDRRRSEMQSWTGPRPAVVTVGQLPEHDAAAAADAPRRCGAA
jgi:hypothetical protein